MSKSKCQFNDLMTKIWDFGFDLALGLGNLDFKRTRLRVNN